MRRVRSSWSPACALLLGVWLAACSRSGGGELAGLEGRPVGELLVELNRHLPKSEAVGLGLVLGDVDRDGDLDVVFGALGQNRLHLNDGAASFADVSADRLPVDAEQTLAVQLGDVDSDGDLDLVLANFGRAVTAVASGENGLYLNDGTGKFVEATTAGLPGLGRDSHAVVLGDVDGDGDLDVVFGNHRDSSDGQDRLYLNDGAGGFADATAEWMPLRVDDTHALALADVDADGDLDLLSVTPSRLYLNDGQRRFVPASLVHMPQEPGRDLAVADVDGDADVDVVTDLGNLGSRNLLLNDGSGRFVVVTRTHLPAFPPTPWLPSDISAGDLDGDGDVDLVFGSSSLYLNEGTGIFVDASDRLRPNTAEMVLDSRLGDVDGDGDLDLVVANHGVAFVGGPNRLFLNDGQGYLSEVTRNTVLLGVPDLAVSADLDGDGDPDLLHPTQGLVQLNDGRGSFAVHSDRLPPTRQSTAAATGDFDGDGDIDLVVGVNTPLGMPGSDRLLLNDGSGRFVEAPIPNRALALEIVTGDVDRDGDLDLVLAQGGQEGKQTELYLNDGRAGFSVATARMPPDQDETSGVALGDVDGDGDLDLALARKGAGAGGAQSRLYLNDGVGTFTDATANRLPVESVYHSGVEMVDLDLDGDLDLLFGSPSGDHCLYLNDGTAKFVDASTTLPACGLLPVVSDIDGDGDPDLVYPGLEIYLNGGRGGFTRDSSIAVANTRVTILGPAIPRYIDVDLDGDVDQVLTGRGRIWFSLIRHLYATVAPRLGRAYSLSLFASPERLKSARTAVVFVHIRRASLLLPLPPYGRFGLDPVGVIPLPATVIPAPAGHTTIGLAIPAVAELAGQTLYSQALIYDLTSERGRLTNVSADEILR
ncbi:MAG: VCBS repeat-containing protein [Planctomycetota bacterium]